MNDPRSRCERCRRQKVRCSGSRPCDTCRKRNLTCTFNFEDQKIMVTRRHAVPSSIYRSDCHDGVSPFPTAMTEDGQEDPYTPNSDCDSQPLTNPLSTGRSAFSTAGNGFTFYLGTSSNWSFTRRILSMTHERLFHTPLPTDDLGFDCMIYELDWGGSRAALSGPASPVLPSLDHCIYLINAVKFHCCQIFHLFDEETFMQSLYRFYEDPLQQPQPSEELWYVHFLLILAFGKGFTTKKPQGKSPPGEAYFSKALHLLPNMIMLWTRPVAATEILCCIALYLHCIDSRIVAHNYIGQAMRLAMGCGLHTDMGTEGFSEGLVERSRRAWWTVYILDREMTSLMGLPQSNHDCGVSLQLPSLSGSTQRTAALSIRIKISRIMAKINDTVYGTQGQKDRKFLLSTKAALSDIAGVADELRLSFPVERETARHGLSRISAHLHLQYHQCIILATRPLLYFFLQIRLSSANECLRRLNSSETVRNLILMCLDSSLQSITLLRLLQAQGLLEVFLPSDLDSLFVSTVSAMVAFVLDVHLNQNIPAWLQKSYSIFEEFITFGNRVALFRKSELVQLHGLLNSLPLDEDSAMDRPSDGNASGSVDNRAMSIDDIPSNAVLASPLLPPFSTAADASGSDIFFESLMTTAEITEMANSIDNLDAEWMSQTVLEQCNDMNFGC
ncbi:Zn(II)2Cys6 transcription factor [Xylaria arbuscula]|nr:Zn(II)2Cys6 transcription factor [Xylaria arbuscula]